MHSDNYYSTNSLVTVKSIKYCLSRLSEYYCLLHVCIEMCFIRTIFIISFDFE